MRRYEYMHIFFSLIYVICSFRYVVNIVFAKSCLLLHLFSVLSTFSISFSISFALIFHTFELFLHLFCTFSTLSILSYIFSELLLFLHFFRSLIPFQLSLPYLSCTFSIHFLYLGVDCIFQNLM